MRCLMMMRRRKMKRMTCFMWTGVQRRAYWTWRDILIVKRVHREESGHCTLIDIFQETRNCDLPQVQSVQMGRVNAFAEASVETRKSLLDVLLFCRSHDLVTNFDL